MTRLALLTIVLLLTCASPSRSQSTQDYDAHLAKLQRSIPEWRAQIEAVDPTKIVIPYHVGKLIEDSKKVLLQNLDLVSLYSTNIPSKRSLSAEIDLYALLREVHSNIDMLSDTLLGMVADNQKTAQAWAEQLGAITSGPLNTEEQYQIKSLDAFANDLERRCGSLAK